MRRILKNDASQKMSRAVTCKVSEKFHTREIAKSPFFAKKDMDCGLLPRSSRCPDDVAWQTTKKALGTNNFHTSHVLS